MQQPAKCILLCCQCTDTYPVHPFRDRHDLSLFLPVVCHCIKRRFLILYTGNASLQTSPDRKGDPALCYRPYFICPWKSCCRSRSCWAYPVAFSKCVLRRNQSAFILGLPANEIVLPIILMAYTAQGNLTGYSSTLQLKQILTANGWTWTTAVCVMLFSLMHWPCSTTLITIYKETKSARWTLVSAILPAFFGALCCILFTAFTRFFLLP